MLYCYIVATATAGDFIFITVAASSFMRPSLHSSCTGFIRIHSTCFCKLAACHCGYIRENTAIASHPNGSLSSLLALSILLMCDVADADAAVDDPTAASAADDATVDADAVVASSFCPVMPVWITLMTFPQCCA